MPCSVRRLPHHVRAAPSRRGARGARRSARRTVRRGSRRPLRPAMYPGSNGRVSRARCGGPVAVPWAPRAIRGAAHARNGPCYSRAFARPARTTPGLPTHAPALRLLHRPARGRPCGVRQEHAPDPDLPGRRRLDVLRGRLRRPAAAGLARGQRPARAAQHAGGRGRGRRRAPVRVRSRRADAVPAQQDARVPVHPPLERPGGPRTTTSAGPRRPSRRASRTACG